ncbi:MAG: carbohydrate kinase family protein [Sphingomonadales bacterium]|nr:MAG: carbohydrate kinase family protein [Sphingomonadales bacterium]
MALRAIVSGFATLDYVMDASADIHQTTVPVKIHPAAWPRAGGAALYASAQFAALGITASPLVAIGRDPAGDAYRRACQAAGLDEAAIDCSDATRTPLCMLVHQDDGGYRCFLDAGTAPDRLNAAQSATLAAADLICVSAGNPAVTARILDGLRPGQRLAWIVKADRACFPLDLRARLLARADFVFFNKSERAFIESAPIPPATLQVETRGTEGVMLWVDGWDTVLPINAIAARDTTGAGDTFAGHMLAQLLLGAQPEDAARLAITATAAFLLEK